MKKLLTILFCAFSALAFAQHDYSISGSPYSVPGVSGVDYVLIFSSLSAPDAYITYEGNGVPVWKDFSGAQVQSGKGAETLYPQDATGYLLYDGDSLLASFYVLDYSLYKPDVENAILEADMQCEESLLTLTADIPEMAYRTTAGSKKIIDRLADVRFTTLSWTGEEYQDSVVYQSVILLQNTKGTIHSQTLSVDAPFRNTDFVLLLDSWVDTWGEERDSILSEEKEAVAVCMHPKSVTTTRNYNNLGVENEPSRPIEEGTLSGSAPLEINFEANANKPVAMFYKWRISKGSDLIVERFDETQRYTFMENGSYQVKVWAYNDQCTTDSAVFDVSVSESLLRVPNVFTPNGDGTNDEFRVVYRSLAEFHCWIYNRWGKLVYQWDDPAKGWDGTINGKPAAEGAYFYIIRAKGTDADANGKYHKATIKRPADIGYYQLSGHVNLIRGKK